MPRYTEAMPEAEILNLAPDTPQPEPSGDTWAMPATQGQVRFWSLDQLNPGNPALNMPLMWQFTGPLDRDALARAFARCIERHETLRTTFGPRRRPACADHSPRRADKASSARSRASRTRRPARRGRPPRPRARRGAHGPPHRPPARPQSPALSPRASSAARHHASHYLRRHLQWHPAPRHGRVL